MSAPPRPLSSRPLVRVRKAEAPDDEGGKKVWHSTGDGVDLVTVVDGTAHAQMQELTFHGRYVVWVRGAALKTGSDEEREPKTGRASARDTRFDAKPNVEVLREALTLVAPGETDRYLLHLGAVVNEALVSSSPPPRPPSRVGDAEITSLAPPRVPSPTWKERIRRMFGG